MYIIKNAKARTHIVIRRTLARSSGLLKVQCVCGCVCVRLSRKEIRFMRRGHSRSLIHALVTNDDGGLQMRNLEKSGMSSRVF